MILWYTGRQVIDGALTLGALTAFLLYGVAIGSSLGTLASLYGQFREGSGSVQRVFELLDERPTVIDPHAPQTLGPVAGRITFEAVSFGYGAERNVLRSIDLDIAPGEVLAVVGPSGAGKTTLCNLIPRLWDVTSGRILVDGIDIREVAVRELREAIGLMVDHGASVAIVGLAPSQTDGLDTSPVARNINALFESMTSQFPGKVLYIDPDPIVAPDGRPHLRIEGPDGTLRVRKADLSHFCPDGSARFGAAVTSLLSAVAAVPSPASATWAFGRWRADPRFDDPHGACS